MAKKNGMIKILSEGEVQIAAKTLRVFLSIDFPYFPKEYLFLIEVTVRMSSLSNQFKEARESTGLSIKDVANKLKVPQYRLKAIEDGYTSEIRSDVFWKYCEFLDLMDFAEDWIDSNRNLAAEFGLISSKK